ncbi:hypothetical protein Tco_0374685 [Tanacetum coccineum]
MSMPVQMSQAQDDKRLQVDDQRIDLADDLKEAQDHISSSITSHKRKITTSKCVYDESVAEVGWYSGNLHAFSLSCGVVRFAAAICIGIYCMVRFAYVLRFRISQSGLMENGSAWLVNWVNGPYYAFNAYRLVEKYPGLTHVIAELISGVEEAILMVVVEETSSD